MRSPVSPTVAKKQDMQVSIVDLSVDNLLTMDEVFVSNSLIGMKSVTKFAGSTYNKQNITTIIFDNLLQAIESHAQAV